MKLRKKSIRAAVKVPIFGFGAVSRGAIYALKAHGFRDITICIQRPDHEVREEVLDCHYVKIRAGNEGEARMMVEEHDGTARPLTEFRSKAYSEWRQVNCV